MSEAVVASKRVTLLELLDRLLETGVVADGKVLISVADVDLIYLGLRLVLSSVATLEQQADQALPAAPEFQGQQAHVVDVDVVPTTTNHNPSPRLAEASVAMNGHEEALDGHVVTGGPEARWKSVDNLKPATTNGRILDQDRSTGQPRLDIEPEKVERGLAKLVLTIVELLRRLMECQAVRRMDQGTLSDDQVERLGQAFSQLEARMEDLKKVFGLEDEELNLDLGPIGKLM